MLRQLERRLDTVCLRLGFALTTHQARQLVSHGHVSVNGKRIDVPSAQVREGDVITLSPKARNFVFVRESLEITPDPPVYLYRNKDEVSGTFTRNPERDEIPLQVPIDERLIVEFYS
jgi:small subunit ribosomal protein S4